MLVRSLVWAVVAVAATATASPSNSPDRTRSEALVKKHAMPDIAWAAVAPQPVIIARTPTAPTPAIAAVNTPSAFPTFSVASGPTAQAPADFEATHGKGHHDKGPKYGAPPPKFGHGGGHGGGGGKHGFLLKLIKDLIKFKIKLDKFILKFILKVIKAIIHFIIKCLKQLFHKGHHIKRDGGQWSSAGAVSPTDIQLTQYIDDLACAVSTTGPCERDLVTTLVNFGSFVAEDVDFDVGLSFDSLVAVFADLFDFDLDSFNLDLGQDSENNNDGPAQTLPTDAPVVSIPDPTTTVRPNV